MKIYSRLVLFKNAQLYSIRAIFAYPVFNSILNVRILFLGTFLIFAPATIWQ